MDVPETCAGAEMFDPVSGVVGGLAEPADSVVEGFPVVIEAAHAVRCPRGEDPMPVEFAVVEVHAQEPARVQGVADQPAVGGPVDVEGIQRQEAAVAVSGDPVG